MAITQTQAKVQEKSKIQSLAIKPQEKHKKPQIVSYEIPDSFNPFATGERLIRLEDELKNQRELMQLGFESMNKRFEAVDKRFEDMNKRFESESKNQRELMKQGFESVDKRFNMMMWIMGGGFTIAFGALSFLIFQAG